MNTQRNLRAILFSILSLDTKKSTTIKTMLLITLHFINNKCFQIDRIAKPKVKGTINLSLFIGGVFRNN